MLLIWGAPLIFTGCATISPPLPPSLELPKPPSDLKAARKGDQITLTWTVPAVTTDRQTIRSAGPTEICRSLSAEVTECGTPIAKVPAQQSASKTPGQKIPSSYTDTLSAGTQSNNPSSRATYAVEVLNTAGRGAGLSNQVHVPLIRTLPPPNNFQGQVTSQGVVLTWIGENPPAIPNVHFIYRIYRRRADQQRMMLVHEVPFEREQHVTFTDSQIEWEKTYDYHVEVVTVIAQPDKPEVNVEGTDSPEIKVFANDVFPPAVPSGLQAVFSGPGQQPFIDLVWSPDADVDLAGYDVYRHTEGSPALKLNTDLVKNPAYRDMNVEPGKRYYYSVTAVDVQGNESGRSEEASEAVPQ